MAQANAAAVCTALTAGGVKSVMVALQFNIAHRTQHAADIFLRYSDDDARGWHRPKGGVLAMVTIRDDDGSEIDESTMPGWPRSPCWRWPARRQRWGASPRTARRPT